MSTKDFGSYEGRTFKADRFAEWRLRNGIAWLRLPSEKIDLSDAAFKEAARRHLIVARLRALRAALSEMGLNDLAVRRDRRNRTLISVFRARTGRNQPSDT